jgi:hypothetical protein
MHGAAKVGGFSRKKRGEKDFLRLSTGRALTGLGIFHRYPSLVMAHFTWAIQSHMLLAS